MMDDWYVPFGTQTRIAQSLNDFKVSVSGDDLELCASVVMTPEEQRVVLATATTVAIHMDRTAAMNLWTQLRETFQRMGWPLPK